MHKKISENNNIYVKSAKIIIYKKTKVCYYQGIERRKRGKELLQTIENVNAAVNNFVWGVPAMVCIIGVGLVLSARTGFIQFRKFGYAIKNSIGRIFTKSEAKEGSITPFQAVCTALAATVGTGNIAGVAGAIAIGGAGAVFWMWIIALLGSASAFVESSLAQLYKRKGKESFIGGPAYYMRYGLGLNWMGILFAILISVTFGFAFNSVQSNTICAAMQGSFGFDPRSVGAVLTVLTLAIIFGGIQRIAKVSSVIVPVMALGYVALASGIVLFNITELPAVIKLIVSSAFGWEQAAGGTIGAAKMQGIKSGLFSNEAGMG